MHRSQHRAKPIPGSQTYEVKRSVPKKSQVNDRIGGSYEACTRAGDYKPLFPLIFRPHRHFSRASLPVLSADPGIDPVIARPNINAS